MSTMAEKGKADAQTLKTNEKKWTKAVMAAGWNVIPNIIIEKQEALGLDAIDMNIVVHLSHYWWHPEKLPHPSVATIAKAIGVKPRTVQKHIKGLEDAGLVRRNERRHTKTGSATNLYDLSGLISAATPFAKEKVKEVDDAKAAKAARLARKKPRLVVNNEEN